MWNRVLAHPGFQQFKTTYNDQFPLEVRFVCAEWIEENIRNDHFVDIDIDIDDVRVKEYAVIFMRSLIDQLEKQKEKYKNLDQMSIKYRVEDAIHMFRENMLKSFETYMHIRNVIRSEQHFLNNTGPQLVFMDTEADDITQKISKLNHDLLLNKAKQDQFNEVLGSYSSLEIEKEFKNAQAYRPEEEPLRLRVDKLNLKQDALALIIKQISIDLLQSLHEIITEIENVLNTVIVKRLGRWQREQAFIGNGAKFQTNALDHIQEWYKKLAKLIWTTQSSCGDIRKLNASSKITMDDMDEKVKRFYTRVTQLLQQLIVSGYIVEKQPNQVIKTNTRFSATVRLLAFNVGIQLNNTSVSASILTGKIFCR